jgi:hypothetical protein
MVNGYKPMGSPDARTRGMLGSDGTAPKRGFWQQKHADTEQQTIMSPSGVNDWLDLKDLSK